MEHIELSDEVRSERIGQTSCARENLNTTSAMLRLVDFIKNNDDTLHTDLQKIYRQNKDSTLVSLANDLLKSNDSERLPILLTIPLICSFDKSTQQEKINELLELKIIDKDEEIINIYMDLCKINYKYDFNKNRSDDYRETYYKMLLFKIYSKWYGETTYYYHDIQGLRLIDKCQNIFLWNFDFIQNRRNLLNIISEDNATFKNVIMYLENLNDKYFNVEQVISDSETESNNA